MGCASSAPIVPPGGVVSPEAPPYELKNAAENAEDSVTDKIKSTVGNMTQDTMSQFVGGANQLKEEAMSKIHGEFCFILLLAVSFWRNFEIYYVVTNI